MNQSVVLYNKVCLGSSAQTNGVSYPHPHRGAPRQGNPAEPATPHNGPFFDVPHAQSGATPRSRGSPRRRSPRRRTRRRKQTEREREKRGIPGYKKTRFERLMENPNRTDENLHGFCVDFAWIFSGRNLANVSHKNDLKNSREIPPKSMAKFTTVFTTVSTPESILPPDTGRKERDARRDATSV